MRGWRMADAGVPDLTISGPTVVDSTLRERGKRNEYRDHPIHQLPFEGVGTPQ